MSDALTVTKYKILEKDLTELGYGIKTSQSSFQIYSKNGALLCMPNTIDGAYAVACTLRILHENNLLK